MANRQIPGYEGLYEVSDSGDVLSLVSKKILASTPDSKRGYQRVWLYKDGVRKEMYVHRAVAMAWVPGDISLTVNHKDGDKQNNKASNLEWLSNADNLRHAFSTGIRKNLGKKRGKTYAIPSDMLDSLFSLIRSGRSIRSVAIEFGVGIKTLQYQFKSNGALA